MVLSTPASKLNTCKHFFPSWIILVKHKKQSKHDEINPFMYRPCKVTNRVVTVLSRNQLLSSTVHAIVPFTLFICCSTLSEYTRQPHALVTYKRSHCFSYYSTIYSRLISSHHVCCTSIDTFEGTAKRSLIFIMASAIYLCINVYSTPQLPCKAFQLLSANKTAKEYCVT
jgi:hypothetical protein